MEQKLKVGILGATGMVGQRFISLLEDHPWFEVVTAVSYTHLDVYKRQILHCGEGFSTLFGMEMSLYILQND